MVILILILMIIMLFCIILIIYLDSAFNGKHALAFYNQVGKYILKEGSVKVI